MAKGRSVAFGQSAEVGFETAHGAFEPPARIQTNLLAAGERRLLDALCGRMPAWITPDRLTAIGLAGMVLAALGYVGSRWSPAFLFLASLGLVLNWFGDSLDGSLARYRRIERPRYGYFLDHSADAIGVLVFALGLGLSPYVSLSASLLLLCSYYLLTMYVFLSAQVDRVFPLARAYVGPTELRLLAIAFNGAIFMLGPISVRLADAEVSIYSALVSVEAVAFIAVFAIEVFATARKLARQDAAGGRVAESARSSFPPRPEPVEGRS